MEDFYGKARPKLNRAMHRILSAFFLFMFVCTLFLAAAALFFRGQNAHTASKPSGASKTDKRKAKPVTDGRTSAGEHTPQEAEVGETPAWVARSARSLPYTSMVMIAALLCIFLQPRFLPIYRSQYGLKAGGLKKAGGKGVSLDRQATLYPPKQDFDGLPKSQQHWIRFVRYLDIHGLQYICLLGGATLIAVASLYEARLHHGETELLRQRAMNLATEGTTSVAEPAFAILRTPMLVAKESGIALITASLVSWIFDVTFHEDSFGRYVKELDAKAGTIVEAIEKYDRLMGLFEYRRQIRESYKCARHRIASIADYWIIDYEWRRMMAQGEKASAAWEQCESWHAFTDCEERRGEYPETIVFAGKAPWPQIGADGTLKEFSESDFDRFLGIVWRVVFAHKLRTHLRDERKIEPEILTLIVDTPLTLTVVDNDVFLLLGDPDSAKQSRGTQIVGGREERDRDKNGKKADAHYTLLRNSFHRAQTAREYVQSLFVFVAIMDDALTNCNPFHPTHSKSFLERLGYTHWKRAKMEIHINDEAEDKVVFTEKTLDTLVQVILTQFAQCLPYLYEPNGEWHGSALNLKTLRQDSL